MVILLKIKRRDFFSTRQHSYFGVTHCENSEVQIAVFSKWNVLREWKLVQRFTFCLSSTQCKWEFVKLRYFDFTIWWRHCENHLYMLHVIKYEGLYCRFLVPNMISPSRVRLLQKQIRLLCFVNRFLRSCYMNAAQVAYNKV